jgi:hypothetical protein
MTAECCEGVNRPGDCGNMMAECMKKCRWFPLTAVIIGVSLLLLGYYLDAEVTRILWMIATGLVVLTGTLGVLMISISKRMCG